MKGWIPAAVKLPTLEENGEKVLLYRTMNDQQRSMAVSIHDTLKVKYCQPEETWWMPIPAPPVNLKDDSEEGLVKLNGGWDIVNHRDNNTITYRKIEIING